MINQISWAFPLISLTPHLNTKQNIQRRPGIPSLTFSLLILHTSLHIRRSTRLAKLKQETFICSSVRFCFSQELLPGYLGQPGQPWQSDRTRYLGLCVYGSPGFGLHRSPPVFSILFTAGDCRPLGTLSLLILSSNFLGLSQWCWTNTDRACVNMLM